MNVSNKKEWYRNLDISSKGVPTGIDQVDGAQPTGICYCIISNNGVVERVDVYKDNQKVHYKEFGYDSLGRVVENAMYSPDGSGGWHIIDDIWYYEYDSETGLRTKKTIRMPGTSTAHEILYDEEGDRISEKTITFND
ncbi:MAG: hypothetical protein WAZ21_03520 [Candidatus Saccharimonadales bacterium]